MLLLALKKMGEKERKEKSFWSSDGGDRMSEVLLKASSRAATTPPWSSERRSKQKATKPGFSFPQA